MNSSTTGRGTLRRKADALRAKVAASQAAAQAKLAADRARFAASLPTTAPTPSPALGMAPASPQQPAPVPSASTTPPAPAAPAATSADPEGAAILAEYAKLSGAPAISFFLQHEKAIRLARSGTPADTGQFRHLQGIARTVAATKLPK